MIIDVIIVALGLSSLYRGRHIGFVRQACSTGLFFAGLFAGAWLQPYTVELVNGEALRGVVTAMTTLGLAIVGLSIG